MKRHNTKFNQTPNIQKQQNTTTKKTQKNEKQNRTTKQIIRCRIPAFGDSKKGRTLLQNRGGAQTRGMHHIILKK